MITVSVFCLILWNKYKARYDLVSVYASLIDANQARANLLSFRAPDERINICTVIRRMAVKHNDAVLPVWEDRDKIDCEDRWYQIIC